MWKLMLLTVIGLLMVPVFSSNREDSISEEENDDDDLKEVINSYSSVFEHQDSGCRCRQDFCTCCENNIENICISVRYYEVFDLPAAVGLNITNYGVSYLSAKFNVTKLPCIHLPFIKSIRLCLKLHGFKQTPEYVQIIFDLRAKIPFTSFKVPLGCLLIPRLHPHPDTNKTEVYDSVLKQMGVHKSPHDYTGIKFCNSASGFSPMNIYSLFLVVMLLKIFIQSV